MRLKTGPAGKQLVPIQSIAQRRPTPCRLNTMHHRRKLPTLNREMMASAPYSLNDTDKFFGIDIDAEETFAHVISRLTPLISGTEANGDIFALRHCSLSCQYMFTDIFFDLAHANLRLVYLENPRLDMPFLETRFVIRLGMVSYIHNLKLLMPRRA